MASAGLAAPVTEDELRAFIDAAEESSLVEYKQAFNEGLCDEASKQEFAKDFCSFLNHGAGVLIFGVADGTSRRLTPILAKEAAAGSGHRALELLKSRIVEARKLIVGSSLSQLRPVETSACCYEHIFSAADGGYYVVFGFRESPAERCYVRKQTGRGELEGWPYGRNTKGVQVPSDQEVIRANVTALTVSFEFKSEGVSTHTRDMLKRLQGAQEFSYSVDKETKRHQLVKDLTFTRARGEVTDEEIYGALIQALGPVSVGLYVVDDLEKGSSEKLEVLGAIESIDIAWETNGLSAMSQAGTSISFPPEMRFRYTTQQQWRYLQSCFSADAFRGAGAEVPLFNFGVPQSPCIPLAW